MRPARFLLPALAVATVAMTACGDDDGGSDTTGVETPDTRPESSPSPEGSATAGSSQTDDATASSGAGEDPDLLDQSNTTTAGATTAGG